MFKIFTDLQKNIEIKNNFSLAEKKKLKFWKLNTNRLFQTKMLISEREKGFTSPTSCHFIQQNLIVWNYFYQYKTTSQNKVPLISRFSYVSMSNIVANKVKHFPQLFNYMRQAHKYPSNENGNAFFHDQPEALN